MRKLFFTILILLIFSINFSLDAQNRREQKKIKYALNQADTAFNTKNYHVAIDAYKYVLQLDDDNYHAIYHIAESYRSLYRYNEAIRHYEKISNEAFNDFPLSLFYLGQMLKLKGKYHRSIEIFEDFIDRAMGLDLNLTDEQLNFVHKAFVEIEGSYWAIGQMSNYDFYNLIDPVNSDYNDFAPVIYKDDSILVVTSGRIDDKNEKLNLLDETNTKNYSFTKTYSAWQKYELPGNFQEIAKNQFNNGSGCFIKNGTEYYFTICGKEVPYCQIYFSKLENNQWSQPTLLSETINAKNADTKDPTLTTNGDTIYFSSNKDGGIGGYDIFFSVKDKNGEWQEAQNIGFKLNTAFNEVAPFYYAPKNMLFFSSDGRKGFGGYDVFMTSCKDFGEITNVSTPINSNLDDIYFVMGEHSGYLASNRNYGQGKYDVYTFINIFSKTTATNPDEHLAEIYEKVKTVVKDLPDEAPTVSIRNTNKINFLAIEKVLSEKVANSLYEINKKLIYNDYQYLTGFNQDEQRLLDNLYRVKTGQLSKFIKEELYAEDSVLFDDMTQKERQLVDNIAVAYIYNVGQNYIQLNDRDSMYYANLTILEKNKIDRMVARIVAKKQKQYGPVDLMVFNFFLNSIDGLAVPEVTGILKTARNDKIPANIEVVLLDEDNKIIKRGLSAKTGEFKFTNLDPNKRYSVVTQQVAYRYSTKNRLYVENFNVNYAETSGNNLIVHRAVMYGIPQNIYFGFNEYSLSNDAQATLDRIIIKYRENKNCKITLQAFTDNKGSEGYNINLSQKRGEAAYDYLVTNGVKPQSLEIKAMGMANPVAPNTTWQGRRLNRRVEFVISDSDLTIPPVEANNQ